MGRAAKAILSGLSIKAGFPGAIQISLDANKIATGGIDRGAEDSKAYEPKSFYHASFLAMRSAVEEFLGSSTNGADPAPHANAANRFVVLVDDLDRCVPKKALEVLESMKLFFDLPGFVFVVGLDQQIIEQAVLNKYPAGLPSESGDVLTYISGVDYVKKIFQIQFAVPRVDEVQLAGYIDAMGSSGLPPDQVTDLKNVVVPRAGDMIGTSPLNPREVKRLVNAYTMQLKLLERKLAGRGSPDPSAVLALAIFSFRADWDAAYQALSTSPIEFLDNASDALRKDENTIAVAADLIDLPPSLTSFLAGNGSSLFGLNDQIEVYLSALEAARTIDPDLREISKALGGLRVAHANGSEQGVRERLSELMSRMTSRSSQVPPGRLNLLRNLQERVPQGKDGSEEVSRWLEEVGVALPQLASTINDLQRRSVTAGSSAA
jgi:hypothetical protein